VHNGDTSSEDGAGENESEAETIMLSPAKKAIKTERDDDNNNNNNAIKDTVRARSPSTNGRKPLSLDEKNHKTNGAKHGSEHRVKSPVPTSPSSRTTSRHTKEISPADSAKSPVQSTTSPSQPTTRGRSSSTVESRKRKLRQESDSKSLEPPRQKAKTEGLKDRSQPGSPPTPGLGRPGRPHKRSQSTQSVVSGINGRKRREVTAITLPPDRWSDSSSENSSSPNVGTPNLAPHTRVKRSSHRALESPARTMPHKRNVDKFGATRLARESEKGNYSEVKAAYHAAPEELDQEDFAGIAPLQKAALHGHSNVVEFLISKGCRTDCKSNDQDTPLIDAVENGHIKVVKLLLHKGKVNPHHQNKKGQRAIDVLDPDDDDAEELEKELKAAMQREIKATSTDDYVQPATHQQKTASRLLYNEYNTETLIEKAGDGDILAVGELINSNIKPNIACGVAASRGGHYDILSILLASGLKSDPDPSKHSETPMLVAIGRGHLKIVTLLLEQDTFNPTRRNREGKTYYEISEDRRGPKWELERDMLKTAYDNYSSTHRSPRRTKKEAPNPTGLRMKRKSSPRRERSSSPRHDLKRQHIAKPTAMSQVPQKSRRLMSGKEMANRGDKRRRRVVSDESSSDESEEEVRRPTKKTVSQPRSYSEGEEQKLMKKAIKARSEDHDAPKPPARAQSNDSDEDHRQRLPSKVRTKSANPKPTPDVDSPDERKAVKRLTKSHIMDEKIKKRRPSNDSIDDVKVKKTPTPSAKSTPAPPEKAPTPEATRERREEAEKQAVEAKKKAAEAESRKREEEEAVRKAAEEEVARNKMEAEARAKRMAEEAEARAAHQRQEAEAARKQAEEEAQRQAEEEERRQQELIALQGRIARLPRALRRACELGINRPLHFSGEELGISAVFLPLFYVSSKDLQPNAKDCPSKSYIMSFQAVGILGLPELDLARLDAPYSQWERNPVTRKQRELFLRQYDVALLAQDFCFPMEGTPDFDYAKIQDSIKEARQQFLDMEGLYWIEDTVLYPELEKTESLKPLEAEIRDTSKRRQIQVADPEVEAMREKTHKPRKSFMDVMLGKQGSLVNGIKVNGEG
jgi:ankyrin repeat protein